MVDRIRVQTDRFLKIASFRTVHLKLLRRISGSRRIEVTINKKHLKDRVRIAHAAIDSTFLNRSERSIGEIKDYRWRDDRCLSFNGAEFREDFGICRWGIQISRQF